MLPRPFPLSGPLAALLLLVSRAGAETVSPGGSVPRDLASAAPTSSFARWEVERLPAAGGARPEEPRRDRRPSLRPPSPGVLRDVPFRPTDEPSLDGPPVLQVIVTVPELIAEFENLAAWETRRGIPTVARTVPWIESRYPGPDTPARIRSFLRDAHDRWGAGFAILGGDVELVPTRYVPWLDERIPTDLYYECLDGEWNEDGDAVFGEPREGDDLENLVNDVAPAGPDSIWVATYAGVGLLTGEAFRTFGPSDGLPSEKILTIAAGPEGEVWAGTERGAARWNGQRWETLPRSPGLPSDRVTALLPRGPGDVWVGTDLGVAHWDGTGWRSWSVPEGLPGPLVTGLAHDGQRLWISTMSGAASLEGDTVTPYTTWNSGILSDGVLTVAVDGGGAVWFGHLGHLFRQGGFSRYDGTGWWTDPLPGWEGPSVRSIAFAPGGEMWAATPVGLLHRGPGTDELLDGADGLPSSFLLRVARSGAGRLAVASDAGLGLDSASGWRVFRRAQGLPSPIPDHDDIDLVPDLVTGRLPFSTAEEVAAYVDKLVRYERGETTDHLDRILLLGEVLSATLDGKDACRSAADLLPPGFVRIELYESDGTETAQSARDALGVGNGIVLHVGHGSYDVLGVGPGYQLLFQGDLDALDTGGRAGLVLGTNCNSGGYDQDCAMEHLIRNVRGGAVATIANAREAEPYRDAEFLLDYFRDLWTSPGARPAVSLARTREARFAEDPDLHRSATWHRQLHLTRSYLGAPTLAVWRGRPDSLRVTRPATLPAARAPFPVTVTSAATGLPLPGARVCLTKGDEDYAFGETDGTGSVTFDFRPEGSGSVTIVVTAAGHFPWEGTARVDAAAGANPVAAGWRRIDGAADGAGGTWQVTLGLRNAGGASGSGWSLSLASEDPRLAVLTGEGSLAPVRPGGIGWTSPFTIEVAGTLPDGARPRLVLSGRGDPPFTETFSLELASPSLEADGVLVRGDVVIPRVTNRGTAPTGPLEARLAPLFGGGEVLEASANAPSVRPGETATFPGGFRVSGPARAVYEMTVTGDRGVLLVTRVDVERPEPPGPAASDPREDGARLRWEPSHSPDLAGYRVLVRAHGGWTDALPGMITEGATAHMLFAPGTERTFAVVAVDSTGNESADTSFVEARASDPQLPGWPRRLRSLPGPTGVVPVDLDRDGQQEILLGSLWDANAVHVFRADGTEWTDGDEDPSTAGIFGVTGGRVTAPPLAVDLDGDGRMEIVASSHDGLVHAWRTDGAGPGAPSSLPGWPIPHGSAVRSPPVAGDLDGDGTPEIVTIGTDGLVRALEPDGDTVPGWPRVTGRPGSGGAPAVADLDGDGREDVVFGATDSTLYAVSGSGADLPGWPVFLGERIDSSPILVDVDGDGDLEIFLHTPAGLLWGFHHDDRDGRPGPDPVPGWPVAASYPAAVMPSPAAADLDGDGVPEILAGGDAEIGIWRADGSPYPGAPLPTGAPVATSPIVADIDGDGSLDLLVGLEDDRLAAYRLDGLPVPGWPWSLTETPRATPSVADVDGDGDLDVLLAADDTWLRAVDVPGPARPGRAPWPAYHGGPGLRGVYRPAPPPRPHDGRAGPVPRPRALRLLPPGPNPFCDMARIRFALPGRSRVRIDVYDVRGRHVANLVPGEPFPAGMHAVPWDGRDSAGRPVGAGVYFTRLRAGGESRTGRIVRIR